MKNGKLTHKQEQFVQEYMLDLNATAACIRAGYSARNADKIGWALIGKSRVQNAITKKRAEVMESTEIEIERTLEELGAIGYADTEAIFGPNGEVKPLKEWPKGLTKAIENLEVHEIFSGEGKNRSSLLAVKNSPTSDGSLLEPIRISQFTRVANAAYVPAISADLDMQLGLDEIFGDLIQPFPHNSQTKPRSVRPARHERPTYRRPVCLVQ